MEMTVQINTYDAEFGRGAGGVLNVTVKSGTNQFHGSMYEFWRNDILEANSFINNSLNEGKPRQRYHLFGATAGGPVYTPKVATALLCSAVGRASGNRIRPRCSRPCPRSNTGRAISRTPSILKGGRSPFTIHSRNARIRTCRAVFCATLFLATASRAAPWTRWR